MLAEKSSGLKVEAEGLRIAEQDQSQSIRNNQTTIIKNGLNSIC